MKQYINRWFTIPAFLIAIIASFGFHAAPIKSAEVNYVGYRNVNSLCLATDVECSSIFDVLCTDATGHQLYKLNGTTCAIQLFRIP
jgi:hypothetical protein